MSAARAHELSGEGDLDQSGRRGERPVHVTKNEARFIPPRVAAAIQALSLACVLALTMREADRGPMPGTRRQLHIIRSIDLYGKQNRDS